MDGRRLRFDVLATIIRTSLSTRCHHSTFREHSPTHGYMAAESFVRLVDTRYSRHLQGYKHSNLAKMHTWIHTHAYETNKMILASSLKKIAGESKEAYWYETHLKAAAAPSRSPPLSEETSSPRCCSACPASTASFAADPVMAVIYARGEMLSEYRQRS